MSKSSESIDDAADGLPSIARTFQAAKRFNVMVYIAHYQNQRTGSQVWPSIDRTHGIPAFSAYRQRLRYTS
jgi:hypothetical protein